MLQVYMLLKTRNYVMPGGIPGMYFWTAYTVINVAPKFTDKHAIITNIKIDRLPLMCIFEHSTQQVYSYISGEEYREFFRFLLAFSFLVQKSPIVSISQFEMAHHLVV